MSEAYHKVHNIKQDEKETEVEYGTHLLEVSIQAGDVFDERDLKSIFIDGLSSAVRPLVRQLSKPGMDFEALQKLAFNSGEAFRGTVHLASKTKTMVLKNRPSNLPRPTVAALEEAPPLVPHHSSTSSEVERAPEVSDPPTYAIGDACYELSELPLYPRGLSPTPPSRNWSSATSSPHARLPSNAVGAPPQTVVLPPAAAPSPEFTSNLSPWEPFRPTFPSRGGPRPSACYFCYVPGHQALECPLLLMLPEAQRVGALQRREDFLRLSGRGASRNRRNVSSPMVQPGRTGRASYPSAPWQYASRTAFPDVPYPQGTQATRAEGPWDTPGEPVGANPLLSDSVQEEEESLRSSLPHGRQPPTENEDGRQ